MRERPCQAAPGWRPRPGLSACSVPTARVISAGTSGGMPVQLELLARTGHPDFLDLPWEEPLAEWRAERIVEVARGIHRHVVRFVDYDGRVYALKELPERIAPPRVRAPALARGGVGRPSSSRRRRRSGGPTGWTAVLITRYLDFSLPYRSLFGTRGDRPTCSTSLLDGLALLLARLHLVGFFWGDCSLSNTLFRRDAGALVGVPGRRRDRRAARRRSPTASASTTSRSPRRTWSGELLDVAGARSASCPTTSTRRGGADGCAAVRRRCGASSRARRRSPPTSGSRSRSGCGGSTSSASTSRRSSSGRAGGQPAAARPDASSSRATTARGCSRSPACDAQENQARRHAQRPRRATAPSSSGARDATCPESVAAYRWRAEVFEPASRPCRASCGASAPAAEVFHEILQHRWFLSEQRGRDVGMKEAVRSYVEDVLRHVPDERTVLTLPLREEEA